MAESQKDKIMRVLEVSADEADQILAYDKAVEQGKTTPYDFTAEQEKSTRKFRQAERKRTAYNFTKRERKPNATKGGLIEELYNFLKNSSNFEIIDCEITNKERQIAFGVAENRFELTLVQKRAKKT